jgi:integrase
MAKGRKRAEIGTPEPAETTETGLVKYERGLGSKGNTRTHYLKYAKEFLEHSNGRRDRQAVDDYLAYLERTRHYSGGSLNLVFRIVGTLFRRNGWEWPFRHGEAPVVHEDEVNAPALDPADIVVMIRARDKLDEQERSMLALSTTYGLRRVEMVGLRREDFRGETIFISTAKHGRERMHIVPPEISPFLEDYSFPTVTAYDLFACFRRIEYKSGLEHIEGVAWHSIRRTLLTLLGDHLPEMVVASFLRWKQRTSAIMPFRYSAIRFVGSSGTRMVTLGESRTVDEKVFQVHPFVKEWQ